MAYLIGVQEFQRAAGPDAGIVDQSRQYYPMSPFSEKVRLMFGYTGGEWLSVISPEMPPRPLPAATGADARIGKTVVIRPDDYALDGSRGVLVAADEERWILARETDTLGLVHVHFPRRGFRLD